MRLTQRTNISIKVLIMVVILTTVVAFLSLTTFAFADKINPGVFSKDSSPYGISYKDWITKWWQWHIAIPPEKHPWQNYSPEKCAVNQDGPVWFLTGLSDSGSDVRECSIPKGKGILFQILGGECDYGIHTVKSDPDLIPCASEGNEFATISATVDGVRLKHLEQYITHSDYFNITIPQHNVYQADPGRFRAFVDGYFVFLEPLSPGKHEIKYIDSVNNPVKPEYNHAKDITYHITVTP